MATIIQGTVSFPTVSTTLVSVNSTSQILLFTGSVDLKVFVVSNQSGNKILWLKPGDDTTTKQGIIIGPGKSESFPVTTTLAVFGIMDSGGSVDISIVEFS